MKLGSSLISIAAFVASAVVAAHAGIAHDDIAAETLRTAAVDVARTGVGAAGEPAGFDWATTRLPGERGAWPLSIAFPSPVSVDAQVPDDSTVATPQVLSRMPSSLLLGLTALAGMGLYHAGQSIRRVQGPLVAEWYHTGGPQQIGHATPLDLDTLDLPPCVLDPLVPQVESTTRFVPEAVLRIPFDILPLATAPRAPPAISSHR